LPPLKNQTVSPSFCSCEVYLAGDIHSIDPFKDSFPTVTAPVNVRECAHDEKITV
jgi:hypothetical protein